MQKAHYSNLPTHKENHLSMDPLQIVTFKQILLLNMCQISNHLSVMFLSTEGNFLRV